MSMMQWKKSIGFGVCLVVSAQLIACTSVGTVAVLVCLESASGKKANRHSPSKLSSHIVVESNLSLGTATVPRMTRRSHDTTGQ